MIRSTRTGGFTLVELLIVIGIISILLALLLPVASRVQEQTRRAVCLSNVGQLAKATHQRANDRDGGAVLGYWGDKQFNYPVNVNQGGFQGLGPWGALFARGKYVPNVDWIICPSQQEESFTNLVDQTAQNTSGLAKANQWPIQYEPANDKLVTRSTYGLRPVKDVYNNRNHTNQPTRDDDVLPEVDLADYAHKAIMTDVISYEVWVDRAHVEGINVAYGDGSAQWVRREVIQDGLSIYDPPVGFNNQPGNNMLNDDETDGMFADLDQVRGSRATGN